MKLSKRTIIIINAILLFLIIGGIAYFLYTPAARAEHQLNLGDQYLQEGKYQEAIVAFQKVIKIDSMNILARLGLGKAYTATIEYIKAKIVLKEVISLDPNNIPAREQLLRV